MGIFRRGMTAARLVPLLLLVGSAHAQDKDGCHNVCHVDKCKGTLTNPLPRGEQWKTKSVKGPKTCCAGSNEQCHVCCPSSSSGSSQKKTNDAPKSCSACLAANTGALSAREAKKVWCTTDNTCLDGPSTAARSKCSNDGTLAWKSCPKKAEAAYSEAPKPPPAPPKAQPVLKGCDERSKAECEATPSLSKTKKCVWDATSDGYASCHAVSIKQKEGAGTTGTSTSGASRSASSSGGASSGSFPTFGTTGVSTSGASRSASSSGGASSGSLPTFGTTGASTSGASGSASSSGAPPHGGRSGLQQGARNALLHQGR